MSTMTPNDNAVITEADDQELSTAAIAIICVCVVFGVALMIGFSLIIRRIRKRMHAQAGFINVDDGNTSPWKNTSCSLPPPETHDLVFSSILEHPPRAPPSSHQTPTAIMFEDGYERHNDADDKILMSLARQEWTDQYRPSTPQQHHHNQQRWSNNSSYHVW